MTVYDLFESIAERLASARTRALMGERQEALGLFRGASLDFTRFRESLRACPGYLGLEYAFETTLNTLEAEADIALTFPEKDSSDRAAA